MTDARRPDDALARPNEGCIHVTRSTSGVRVIVEGSFEEHQLAELDREITAAATAGQTIALDLRRVTWIDNPVVGWLVALAKRAEAHGWQLQLTALNDRVRRTLAMGSVIDQLPSEDADSVPQRQKDRQVIAWDDVDPGTLDDGTSCG